jgi:hypothetical protein
MQRMIIAVMRIANMMMEVKLGRMELENHEFFDSGVSLALSLLVVFDLSEEEGEGELLMGDVALLRKDIWYDLFCRTPLSSK